MHKATLVAAAMAAIGVTSGAEAAVFSPGDNIRFEVLTPQVPDLYGSEPAPGAFTDTYNLIFEQDEPDGSFRATLTSIVGISDLTIELLLPFNLGDRPAVDRDPDPLSFLLLGGFAGGSFINPDSVYRLRISGTAAAGASYAGTGLALPTPVPLALPMLGAALAGLAGLGMRRQQP
jgi:hypothetical protein